MRQVRICGGGKAASALQPHEATIPKMAEQLQTLLPSLLHPPPCIVSVERGAQDVRQGAGRN